MSVTAAFIDTSRPEVRALARCNAGLSGEFGRTRVRKAWL
jgi:hypothetical protein